MPRTISLPGSYPISGEEILLQVPDLQKPKEGEWRVDVRLRETSVSAGCDLQLIQAGKVIAEKSVTPTNSYATYTLEISPVQQEEIDRGRCHMSELFARVRPSNCCLIELPPTLTATLSNVNLCECVAGSILLSKSGDRRTGSGSLGSCGGSIDLEFYCQLDSGEWRFVLEVTHHVDVGQCYGPLSTWTSEIGCNPIFAQFFIGPTGTFSASGCCGSVGFNDYIITITE